MALHSASCQPEEEAREERTSQRKERVPPALRGLQISIAHVRGDRVTLTADFRAEQHEQIRMQRIMENIAKIRKKSGKIPLLSHGAWEIPPHTTEFPNWNDRTPLTSTQCAAVVEEVLSFAQPRTKAILSQSWESWSQGIRQVIVERKPKTRMAIVVAVASYIARIDGWRE